MPAYHIILDLEMNPVSPICFGECGGLKAETIEFGAVKIDAKTNQIVDEYTCVVKPQFNHRIEPHITRLTGISTRESRSGVTFKTALEDFILWIGQDEVKMYSWSNTDYSQLKRECGAKRIDFPEVFSDWTDFQAEYPKYLGYSQNRCFSLKDAANLIGATMISGRAHRALYDAQVTAKLVLFALTEEYKSYNSRVSDALVHAHSPMTFSIGDTCGGKLAALMAKMKEDEEREESRYGGRLAGTVPALVR